MTDQKRLAELESRALPIPTRADMLASAITFFKMHPDQKFRLFHGVEYMSFAQERELQVVGTMLEPINMALNAAGIKTDGTVGNLLDLQVLNDSDVHCFTCDCHISEEEVDGATASLIFQARAMHA